jgi:hypothetical protein
MPATNKYAPGGLLFDITSVAILKEQRLIRDRRDTEVRMYLQSIRKRGMGRKRSRIY